MKIAIGTTNKAKIAAVETVANDYLEQPSYTYVKAASQVANQPMTHEETRLGAIHRAKNTLQAVDVQLAFGLEGGITEIEGAMYVCNWGALVTADGDVFTAAGAQILLPEEIAQEIRNGKELGPVMNDYTQRQDIRQNEGAIGIFTHGLINRQQMFEHIVKLLIGQYFYTVAQKGKKHHV
ncbi:DUF84 family protein [Lysinibacillus piscis]|uniref:inosine/xanthosine triphosphatase n=1 Tax=Lysinibacillus piscis TaxID=2518931 RepID=A0ABQ5NIJ5_9BACI|nr:DUF84 family protein [Lysinibacillus sp. KH24]GLC88195.1 NTPase [Lysinibacillus sp. KH24]